MKYISENCSVNANGDKVPFGEAEKKWGAHENPEPVVEGVVQSAWEPPPRNPYYWGRFPGETREDAEARRSAARANRGSRSA